MEVPSNVDALIEAAKEGDEPRVRALIAGDPALAAARLPSGESPVMAALYRGHRALALVLVDLGAELDVFASAALGHRSGLIASLERPGAVTAHAYDGWTALHLACFFGHLEAARILIDAGADLRAVSRNSLTSTALHAAAAGKHEAIALFLLERGADPQVLDAGGHSAARIAKENGLTEVVRRTTRLGPQAPG